MGVIDRKIADKRTEKGHDVQPSEDELSIPDNASEASTLSLVTVPLTSNNNGNRRARKKLPVQFGLNLARPRKHCGQRRLRYYRAVEDLCNAWQDSEDAIELSIHDFMELKPSPFAILLQDSNLLQAWWEFVSTPEEVTASTTENEQSSTTVVTKIQSPPMPPEYKKIEKPLKELLQKRSMDVNMVSEVELQLVEFFRNTPKEQLKMKRLSRYETMINTAVCQYHGLQSQASPPCRKRNDLFVTLLGESYTQPKTALHSYLEERQKFYGSVIESSNLKMPSIQEELTSSDEANSSP